MGCYEGTVTREYLRVMAGPLTLYRPQMIANRGRNTVKVPANLASGRYLVRFDLLALHEGQSPGGAQVCSASLVCLHRSVTLTLPLSQFYPSCAQIEVTGSGSTALPPGVAIPGFYTSSTPGVVWVRAPSSFGAKNLALTRSSAERTCIRKLSELIAR